MKLSEAIRLGSMMTEKIMGSYIARNTNGVPVRTCALGAAVVATGDTRDCIADVLEQRFPIITRMAVYPAPLTIHTPAWLTTGTAATIGSNIAALNDTSGWSREQIADWVQSIEEKQAVRPVGPVVAVERVHEALTINWVEIVKAKKVPAVSVATAVAAAETVDEPELVAV